MENASKALIMAGAVLISLLVISLLVIFFNNLRDMQNINLSAEQVQQAAEFNKQYDVYARDVYGSELLSIANKIVDYNKRESDNKGYTELNIYLILNSDIDSTYFTQGTYKNKEIEDEINKIKNAKDSLGENIIEFTPEGSTTKISRKISKLATMRTSDIEALGNTDANYREKIAKYNSLKTLITEVKAKVFRCNIESFDYDENTGRITKMFYEL